MSPVVWVSVDVRNDVGGAWIGKGPDLLTALDGLLGVLPDVQDAPELHRAIAPTELRIRIEPASRWWWPPSWGSFTFHVERLPGHVYRVAP